MDLIILSCVWFFTALLVIKITAVYEYKRGYEHGYNTAVYLSCPDEIEVDEVTR